MRTKPKIAIVGIGGVGGYLGGRLAARYAGSGEAEIIFLSRGSNAAAIGSAGLKLMADGGGEVVHPTFLTDTAADMGIVDVVVCCTKTYDLDKTMEQIRGSIGQHTVIVSFLNGLDASERIRKLLPGASVWDGCAYIVSTLTRPGIVKVVSQVRQFYFGGTHYVDQEMTDVHALFKEAGIDVHLSNKMQQVLWEKFLFISPFATITSCLDIPIGKILNKERNNDQLVKLTAEVKGVAEAAGISFGPDIIENLMKRYTALPAEATSSMHNDYRNGKKTELDALITHVIDLARKYHVYVPTYKAMLEGILHRWAS